MSHSEQQSIVRKLKNMYHYVSAYLAAFAAGFPGKKLIMIGVTGTDGKTTTSTMIYHILKSTGKKAALITSIKAVYGDIEVSTGLHVTTQNPKELQPLLKQMLSAGIEYVVLETTSHGLHQHRVLGIDFDVAVVTNVTDDHLDYHGTYDNYLQAKAKLFRLASRKSAKQTNKTGVLNTRDKSFNYLSSINLPRRYCYNVESPCDGCICVRATDIKPSINGVAFDLSIGNERISITLPIIGSYNVDNAQAAAAAAHALGISLTDIKRGLECLAQIDGRMERIPVDQDFTVLVDFAHTSAALEHALRELRPLTRGRLIVVFGCAGQRDPTRRRMGGVAARLADIIVITNEDNRDEPIGRVMEEIASYARAEGAREGDVTNPPKEIDYPIYFKIPDRREALRFALLIAKTGDVIDATGKGHEQSLNVDGEEKVWDDRVVVRTLVEELQQSH
jgi:UDP-N-acetylmuramoyl-L-alanyl-D-glutamate--2,6-diaminopimelate ligase